MIILISLKIFVTKSFNIDQHFGTYPITKLSSKNFDKYFKNWNFSLNFETLGHSRGLKMTVSESLILHG